MNDSLGKDIRGLPATPRRFNWTAMTPDEPTRAKGVWNLEPSSFLLASSLAIHHRAHRQPAFGADSVPHSLACSSLVPRLPLRRLAAVLVNPRTTYCPRGLYWCPRMVIVL